MTRVIAGKGSVGILLFQICQKRSFCKEWEGKFEILQGRSEKHDFEFDNASSVSSRKMANHKFAIAVNQKSIQLAIAQYEAELASQSLS